MNIDVLGPLAAQRLFIVYILVPKPGSPKMDKVPFNPRNGFYTDAHDPAAQMTAHEAAQCAANYGGAAAGVGVGIVIAAGSGLFALDLDACLEPSGQWSAWAHAVCGRFQGAAVEISASGQGLHILGRYTGTLAPHGTRCAAMKSEAYTAARFIALTGNSWVGDINSDHTAALTAFLAEHFPPRTDASTSDEWRDTPVAAWSGPTDDAELIGRAVRAQGAPGSIFGAKASFMDLWTANADRLVNAFPSSSGDAWDRSAADMALASHLSFWTGGHHDRIERLMRQSGLDRDKWGREDYLRGTISRACASQTTWYHDRRAALVPEGTIVAESPVSAIPVAQHLCTDQANAERLQKHYGNKLIVCAGSFHAWDGARWKLDDSLAQRFACELSKIVRAEADAMRIQAEAAQAAVSPAEIAASLEHPRLKPLRDGETGSRAYDLGEVAKALDAWSKKCEMKNVQDAALGLLKKLLKVEPNDLDADPWLLNCVNGTVDLRSGTLREHRPADLITRLAPVAYDPAAQAPRFRAFLHEIFASPPVVDFLSRWFGYAATGSIREQKLVFHWGAGSNGKSTLIETIEAVLGDYATPAPPGLLTAKNGDDRHPAEIADLHGRRLVTASESEEGAKLREAFIKLTTGGDKLKGRRLYGQLFEFTPTHKLQLLTNYKPQIRGSDFAIWRRILLVPYMLKFGSPQQVASGDADRLGDPLLKEALAAELQGVLTWIVAGAREWYAQGGLRPPAVVLAAGAEYRTEQDRVGEFIRDCCRLDVAGWSAVSALYRSYQAWCHDAGIHPLSRRRFMDEVQRSVPGFQPDVKQAGVRGCTGITLAIPALGFGPAA